MLVDIDDTIIEVHGYAKQGAGYGYSGVRGLNALLATVTTADAAPVIVAQRLRKGSCGSPRGAKRLVADALKTVSKLHGRMQPASRWCVPTRRSTAAHRRCRAPRRRRRVGHRPPGPQGQGRDRHHRRGRLDPHRVHRRGLRRTSPDLGLPGRGRRDPVHRVHLRRRPRAGARPAGGPPDPRPQPAQQGTGQDTLFDTWRFHAFFTTTDPDRPDTVAADKTHRGHAIIEQVHADLKNSALAHLPSGKFTANAAWLVLAVIAFNLTRAAATLTGPTWPRPPPRRSAAS